MQKLIQDSINLNNEQLRLYKIIIPVLEEERTKSVSKRLATKLEKAIADDSVIVSWNPDLYGSKQINIYTHAMKYDNAVTLRYGEWGEMWKCKNEQDVIDQELETAKARAANTEKTITLLQQELLQFDEMVADYKKISEDYENACADFNKKYGNDSAFNGQSVTYTTKEALKEATNTKIAI
jgi:hypothetical protein